ncbi:ABC transporter permease [Aquimarina sp. AD1]|uniref:ABC transporter permease n=1 Tax=Aquimarina TaxID=290174 RepID=UPI000428662D|nr:MULTISPECIES: ABC transporter permease [Aquimarina]AXT55607.1 ABC transporter permease [Aquimarina sp. AD1]RKN37439.1 ABC transporter permease [Aquimarina sp. AD1]
MHRFLASIKKEFLLLLRDPGGLIILFLMPIVLVVTVTLIQDATFKSVSSSSIEILLVDKDNGKLSAEIQKSFSEIEFLEPVSKIDNISLTEEKARLLVASGDYQLAVVIPEGLSKELQNQIDKNISKILEEFEGSVDSLKTADVTETLPDNKVVKLYFDPITQETFRSSVIFAVDKLVASIETKSIYEAFEKELGESESLKSFNRDTFVKYDQINPSLSGELIIPNSVQHNIPAWTLFAIFFMILPLSLNLVHEKGQGTFVRLQTTPINYATIIGGKAFLFLLVSLLQFTLVLLLGLYVFPKLGLPVLDLGNNLGLLYVVALSSGLAAIGLGVLLGTVFNSHEQAAPFGAVLVVLLAAIGGVWVPVFAMPDTMQIIAKISPMNWGLEAFYDCFLRKGSLIDILPEIGLLIGFFISTIVIAILYYEKKKAV